jgi:hypothetical protein
MNAKRTGGPAFPRPASEFTQSGTLADGNEAVGAQDGMSLRDYFAAKALHAAIIAMSNFEPGLEQTRAEATRRGVSLDELLATQAYITADAMLAARGV